MIGLQDPVWVAYPMPLSRRRGAGRKAHAPSRHVGTPHLLQEASTAGRHCHTSLRGRQIGPVWGPLEGRSGLRPTDGSTPWPTRCSSVPSNRALARRVLPTRYPEAPR